MSGSKKSSRRDFIRGRAAIDAIRTAVDSEARQVPLPLTSEQSSVDRQNAYLQHFSKNAMACEFELMFNLQQYTQAGTVAAAAFEMIDVLEDQLSIYRDHSEVSRLNQLAALSATPVSPLLFQLLRIAATIHSDTRGAFDITSTPLSQVWGFDRRDGHVPSSEEIETALQHVGSQYLVFDDQEQTVLYDNPELNINLGGIGKGFALDRVVQMIGDSQVADFIIHGGQSSVVARGSQVVSSDEKKTDQGWTVGLSHPLIPEHRLAEIVLRDEALGTSGTGRQGFFVEGKRYGHIIDPRSGWPTDHFLSATVITPSAALSDALATAFFVMKLEDIELYCRNNKQVKAILVSEGARKGQTHLEWFNLADEDWRRKGGT